MQAARREVKRQGRDRPRRNHAPRRAVDPACSCLLAAVSVGLPLLWAWRLARLDEPSTARWLVKAADIAAFLAFVILIARWDILGLHSRNAILA